MADFYPKLTNLDGRAEFERLLRGDIGLAPIGRQVILRRLTNEHCACWDEKSGGPIAFCSYCDGEGFTFTEIPSASRCWLLPETNITAVIWRRRVRASRCWRGPWLSLACGPGWVGMQVFRSWSRLVMWGA
jgi:hypothetical protein